ncbi:TetR/AcrR family transcriptional regulator [Nocardioides litoris]|uniref:TetR/AcrR family transcriptional regulator n=1 Tax=Nocardioides litoris TaxID=1926648 RepID=UPI001FE7112E|nr:TetR/AcrR family transcriptional regulator [Nocardioides litoris]
MPKSVSKLVPKVPGVPGAGRRASYSASTKRALVDVAEQLFTEHGYSSTSLDLVVAGAEVTKGALYHHFSGKQALFEAVFERVEADAAKTIQQALRGRKDPWEKGLDGLRAFLEVVREPRYRRIVIQDGPSVLGYERFREQEERSTFANVLEIVDSVLDAGTWELDEAMKHTFARIFFGALSTAGESVTTADDPALEARRVEAAIGFMLSGLQALVEQDVELPNAFTTSGEEPDPS